MIRGQECDCQSTWKLWLLLVLLMVNGGLRWSIAYIGFRFWSISVIFDNNFENPSNVFSWNRYKTELSV